MDDTAIAQNWLCGYVCEGTADLIAAISVTGVRVLAVSESFSNHTIITAAPVQLRKTVVPKTTGNQ